ncbi:MAG: DDE-type integrase/transposase/recombinase, partial [Thermoleophilaceae bacterium]
FEALKPRERARQPRTAAEILDQAAELRREAPERTAAQIAEILARLHGGRAPSARTVRRQLARLGLRRAELAGEPERFGRFEAERPNELWVADALHGPTVEVVAGSKRRAILFCLLDDHSRLVVGARFCYAETELRLEAVLRQALEARGLPERLYVDNGAPFASGQLARICAVLGVRLTHSKPRRPEGRGKVERFFRTLRDQFLTEAVRRERLDLAELNRLLQAWLERVYHRRVHSETDQTPLERFAADSPPRYPTARELREAFLWCERRTVTKTATVSLHGNRYEVDPALSGHQVELLFDPFRLEQIEVRYQGRPFGIAAPHTVSRHVHPRAEAEARPQPRPRTGIDYLTLVTQQHEAQLARRISYRDIASGDQAHDHQEQR